jgi:hypothetical protein
LEIVQLIPWKEILSNPNSAWALVFILLLIYVMYQNGKREERLTGIIEGTLRDMTETLASVRSDVGEVKKDIDELRRGE